MIVDRSITVRPGTYRLAASPTSLVPPSRSAARTSPSTSMAPCSPAGRTASTPTATRASAILVEGGRRITIKNAVIRGYKVGILARRSPDLRLSHNDLCYNWKPRLYSGVEKESLVDWMSYHQNDKDEWLTRGAAIYLAECDRAEIDHNTAVQGQNGLMITRSTGLKIWNNTFQFLSGLGVGLYRTTDSTIMHNRIDWCVRGYSHGFYNRGQDSAGLLMYEQSSKQHGRLQLDHARRRRAVPVGRAVDDGYRAGRRERQPLLRRTISATRSTNGIEATFSRNSFYRQPRRGLLARCLGRLQLRLRVGWQPFRAQHGSDRHRARAGQHDRGEHLRRRRDRDSALAEPERRIPTGDIRNIATREVTATCSRATISRATRPPSMCARRRASRRTPNTFARRRDAADGRRHCRA